MILGNLVPEVRKGVITKCPITPEEILEYALLEEKACKNVNPIYNLQVDTINPFPPQPIQQNAGCCVCSHLTLRPIYSVPPRTK